MENLTAFVPLILAILLILAGVMWWNNQKSLRRFLQRQKNQWGNFSEREYSPEEQNSISGYYKKHQSIEDGFFIDDITWNDLDLERIFQKINTTVSSCGESYLYYLLRKPSFSKEELKERDRLMEYFSTHEKERLAVQKELRFLRGFRSYSVSDFIYALDSVEREHTLKYYLMSFGVIASFALMFINPSAGIMLLVLLVSWNIQIHWKKQTKLSSYLYSFSAIMKMAKAGEKLAKQDIPELSEYIEPIGKSAAAMRGLKKRTVALASFAAESNDLLSIFFSYLNLLIPLDLIQFYSSLKFLDGRQQEIEALMKNLGLLDSMIAIASLRESLELWTKPQFSDTLPCHMELSKAYHMLLASPVANSISVKGGTLLTGSNASGKSTFLKTVALNAIFSQTIYTCTAKSYCANMLKVMTSMSLRDSIESGESYFIVEIKALQRILEESQKDEPLLCLVDEVLRGTNTVERIAASSQILRSLVRPQVLAFAATHDIELSHILENYYENYHFEEEIKDGDVLFNYLLLKGRATSRNAISLLEIIGYDPQIVKEARSSAEHFEAQGIWDLL